MITIGERLRILRAKKNFSQEYMAEALGISRPAYVNYETNRTKPVRRLPELARILGVTPDYLLGYESGSSTQSDASNIIQLALKDYPEVLKAIESADFATNTINLGDATINIDDIDLDYIKTSILSAIVMAKQKGENGKLEITVSPKAKLPDT